MLITVKRIQDSGRKKSEITFLSETFHHVTITDEYAEISLTIGSNGNTMYVFTTPDEWNRIAPLLMGDAPAEEEAYLPPVQFENELLQNVASAYDAYKFAAYDEKNTQESIPLRNVLIAAGNVYNSQRNGSLEIYPALIKKAAPVAVEPVAPAWKTGVNNLEFSKIMKAWFMAKQRTLFGDEGAMLVNIQVEKDAYFAVIDYIAKTQPPTIAAPSLPFPLITAYHELRACERGTYTGVTEVKIDTFRRELIDLLGKYIPAEEESGNAN